MDTKTAATQIITVLILTAFVVITNSAPAAINHAEVSFSYRERERERNIRNIALPQYRPIRSIAN